MQMTNYLQMDTTCSQTALIVMSELPKLSQPRRASTLIPVLVCFERVGNSHLHLRPPGLPSPHCPDKFRFGGPQRNRWWHQTRGTLHS